MRSGLIDFARTTDPRATVTNELATESSNLPSEGRERTMPAQQDRRRVHVSFPCNLHNRFRSEKRTARGPQWTVRLDNNALLFTEIDDFLLRQLRVVFNLVCCWDDSGFGEQLF